MELRTSFEIIPREMFLSPDCRIAVLVIHHSKTGIFTNPKVLFSSRRGWLEKLDGVMVSVSGQLDLNYVPFEKLIDPDTLVTMVRFVDPDSDFHRLARFLEIYVNE
jgi:hypothetical protein